MRSKRRFTPGVMAKRRPGYAAWLAVALCLSGVVWQTAWSDDRLRRGGIERVKSGTGFFVSRDGFLLTSAHVVEGCQRVSAWLPGGQQRPSYVVALDRLRDIALLWAEGVLTVRPATASHALPRQGDDVFTLGYGLRPADPLAAVVVEGSFVGGRTAAPGNHVVLIHARLQAGNSGGALLAGDGSLLGMIVGRDDEHPEFGVAVPLDDLEAMLAGYRISLAQPDAVSSARRLLGDISVLIQCAGPGSAKMG
jgi:S1-C subfamily serine protease